MRAARILLPAIQSDLRAVVSGSATSMEAPLSQIYLLLTGLAAENLAKAVIVAGRDAVVTDDRLADDLKTHWLLDLIRRAGVVLSEEDSHLVERLEAHVTWAGRYPIPAKLDDFLPRQHPSGGFGSLAHFVSSDPDRVEALIEQLRLAVDMAERVRRAGSAGRASNVPDNLPPD